jgi:hypothetical protein
MLRSMEHDQQQTQRDRVVTRAATRPDFSAAFAALLFGLLLLAGLLLL